MSFLKREYERSRKGFLQAWVALFLAFPVGFPTLAISGGWVWDKLTHSTPGGAGIFLDWGILLMGLTFFGGPAFLLIRHFIVRPTFPYLRWGFAPFSLVPAILFFVMFYLPGFPSVGQALEGCKALLLITIPPLVVCTLLFVAIARSMGGFGDEWPRKDSAKDHLVAIQ